MKQVELTLIMDSLKKHSVLFKPPANSAHAVQPAVTGLYLMKTAFKELGEPKEIVLTVTAVE